MAKNKLAGITLEIGGDTTELSKALQQPNKEAADLQSKLKAVDQALKLDPTNTDLLAQKQRLLADAITQTESKLNLLKQAQEEFIKSDKNIDSAEYIELEKQIAQTEKKLKDLKSTADDLSKSSVNISKSFKDAGNALDNASQKTKGLSTAAGGLLAAWAATVPATKELNQDLSFLSQNALEAGTSAENAEKAFDTFNNVVNETDSSVEGVSNLLQAGFTESNLQKAVEGLTGAYIKFPDTMKIESLADSLQETLATGQATGQFGELLDRLGIGAENFSDKLANCSTESEKQNLILKTLADNGLNDTYNSYVKNNKALIESNDATQQFQEAIADLSESIMPIITAITKGITELAKWFVSLDPTIQNIVLTVLAFTAALSPALKIFSTISNTISTLVPIIAKLSPVFTTAAKVVTTSLSGILTVLKAVGSVIGSSFVLLLENLAKVAVSAFGLLKTAALTTFNAILAHPIIAGITAIIAVIVLLYTKCEWFRDGVNKVLQEIWNFVQNAFNSIKNFITKTVPETINNIINWFKELPGKIWNTLVSVVNNVKQWGSNLFNAAFDAGGKLVSGIGDAIKSLPSKMFNWGKEMIGHLGDGISSMIGWIGEKAGSIADTIASWLHFSVPDQGPLRKVPTWMPDMMQELGDSIDKNLWMMKKPMENLAKTMSYDFGGSISQALDASNNITVTNPIQIDLDGQPIYKNVVTRITKTQGIRSQFKGAY